MKNRKATSILLRPGESRSYPMGRISAVFKADGDETAERYSISEWWLVAFSAPSNNRGAKLRRVAPR